MYACKLCGRQAHVSPNTGEIVRTCSHYSEPVIASLKAHATGTGAASVQPKRSFLTALVRLFENLKGKA
jgi:hypothetical protein